MLPLSEFVWRLPVWPAAVVGLLLVANVIQDAGFVRHSMHLRLISSLAGVVV